MIKRFLVAAVAAIGLMAASVSASAQSMSISNVKWYASGSLGTAFQPNRDNAVPFGVALGGEFNKYMRAELAFDGYVGGGNSGGNLGAVSTYSFMPKLYLQYPIVGAVKATPYIDVGLGLGLPGGTGSVYGSTLLYTVGAGVMFPITSGFSMGIGYDYVTSGAATPVTTPYGSGPIQYNVAKVVGKVNF